MSNQIYFGDNLKILRKMDDKSVDLIYIDPPFNTKKVQKRTTIKTIRDQNGDRKGFQGNSYKTIDLGTRAYDDSFDDYINGFLKPRLDEAYRILKPHGSLYFHIDYREVHYCKILLDKIFGRESFLNEIIWAYDFGGRAKSRWPAKHDSILFYVKDPKNYIFNTSEIDREEYMAPGLVGFEKAQKGKLPTDTWWFPYVGKRVTDTWWQTIVGTNSKERIGYPTQKPQKLLDRIIRASSHQGNLVLDFFAGSGTVGKSCLDLKREFILIDQNQAALEIMAQRFSGENSIKWIAFDPAPYQTSAEVNNHETDSTSNEHPSFSSEFQMLAATASYIQQDLEEQSDLWKNSPFEWILQLPARKKGMLARKLISSWLAANGIPCETSGDTSETLIIKDHRFALKFSTIWGTGVYKFQQIRATGYEYVICLGISPFDAHCWVFDKKYAIENGTKQHLAGRGAEYWITIDPKNPKEWAKEHGGNLSQALRLLRKMIKK